MSTDQHSRTPTRLPDAVASRERLAETAGRPGRHLRALADRVVGTMPLGSAPSPSDWPGDAADHRADGAIACAVANQIVALLRKHAGRGPTRAKCAITDDLVIVTLANCLTTLETQLAAAGEIALVRRVRRALHQGMQREAIAIVEGLTQRHVVAYLTAQEHDPDLATLAFHLDRPGPTASE